MKNKSETKLLAQEDGPSTANHFSPGLIVRSKSHGSNVYKLSYSYMFPKHSTSHPIEPKEDTSQRTFCNNFCTNRMTIDNDLDLFLQVLSWPYRKTEKLIVNTVTEKQIY